MTSTGDNSNDVLVKIRLPVARILEALACAAPLRHPEAWDHVDATCGQAPAQKFEQRFLLRRNGLHGCGARGTKRESARKWAACSRDLALVSCVMPMVRARPFFV